MKLYESKAKKNPKSCCAGIDISDARNVCKNLGIKHHIIDYESRFKESVIDDFVDSYMNGMTPIPCIKCNQTVKFLDLIEFTKLIGCEVLATGHYVKRVENGGDINLYQADDDLKDQSYFLFATNQDQLNYIRFPLGNFLKSEIRSLASSSVNTSSLTSWSLYISRVVACFFIFLYIKGCVNIGSSASLCPERL